MRLRINGQFVMVVFIYSTSAVGRRRKKLLVRVVKPLISEEKSPYRKFGPYMINCGMPIENLATCRYH
jgi:hypothetical protein